MRHLHAPLLQDTDIQRQIERESGAIHEGVKAYREMVNDAAGRGVPQRLVPVQRLMAHWYKPLRKAILREQRLCAVPQGGKNRSKGRDVYGAAIRLLKPEYLAVITMGNVMRDLLLNADGVKMASLAYEIGRDVLAEANLQLLKQDHRATSSELRKLTEHLTAKGKMEFRRENQTNFEQLTQLCNKLNTRSINHWAKKTLDDPVWSRHVCAHMGVALIWNLIGIATCGHYGEDEEFILAFNHEIRKEGNGKKFKRIGYLSLTDASMNIIDDGHVRREALRPKYLPMIAKPVQWKDGEGGYYVTKTPLVARTNKERGDLLRASEEKMQPFFDGVDALNSTSCQINPFILDVQKHLYRTGGGVAGLPHTENPPMPPYTDDMSDEQKKATRQQRAILHKKIRGLKSERVNVGMIHSMADEMVGHDAIYQVHQADFRGRCYPVQPILTHQNSDIARSLFRFSRSLPVDEAGRRWMKATMADLWGIKGLSQDQAVEVIDSAMSEIERWPEDPERNNGWTRKHSGEPNKKKSFQALAMAHALIDDDAASRIPIQQDGTCNGMQHYAAMGRDIVGARAVNLTPATSSDMPGSVYMDVAQAVVPMIERDASSGDTLAQLIIERVRLDHDCAKQVVMPAVYGMTAVGARQAMYAHLSEADITGDTRYQISMYLGKRILGDALREVCGSTVTAMDWLRSCAKKIADKPSAKPVQWTTPLGFPVIQTYRSTREVTIDTVMQSLRLHMEESNLPVRVGRQVDGFPPNFVHSIDATHLLKTAIKCEQQGIDLMCVHDSFWTHAQNGTRLGTALRDCFVDLHSEPLLESLHAELSEMNPKVKLPEPPAQGDYDIEDARSAFYLFC